MEAEAGHPGPTPASDRELLAQIIERMDRAALAAEMVASFRDAIPGYRRLAEPVLAGQILEVSRRNVDLFFRSILEGRDPTPDELTLFRDSAKNRASEGMPLEDLLRAYRMGGQVAWHAITGAAAGPEEYRALLVGAELLMRYVDQISAAVAQAFLDERQRQVSEEERRLRELLDALLVAGPLSIEIRELAAQINFPIEPRYRPFAFAIPEVAAHEHARIAAGLRKRGILALVEGDRVAGLAPSSTEVGDLAQGGALIVLEEPTPARDLAAALEDVRLVVDLGRHLGHTGELLLDDHLVELLLARSPRVAERLRQRVLAPLDEYAQRRRSDLLETLEAYIDCEGDRRCTAERLHVHPNTLDYRLQRVAELTGLSVVRPADLVLIMLALRPRSLVAVTDPDLNL